MDVNIPNNFNRGYSIRTGARVHSFYSRFSGNLKILDILSAGNKNQKSVLGMLVGY